ncbi:MAG: 4Fe-4S binding protein [Desulfamplus sp.]|nr:4Fe-4S binding protein [Desulfamplus sp.]
MKIVTVRRICQIFFLTLFFWFCITSTLGINWWQLRGWPVNWFLELDPLVGISTLIATGTIYKGLIWGVGTVILTLVFGRFFCGWLCPFGALHQFIGFLGRFGSKISRAQLARLNQYRPAQAIKYAILIFFISSSIAAHLLKTTPLLITGLLDPIPFVYRLVNLTILPFIDNMFLHLSPNPRFYDGAWIIGALGTTALLLNLWIPRFYCRYICPLGALLGWISTISFWQIGKKISPCTRCLKCQFNCEGACEPMDAIRISECVMCMNCLDQCEFLTYQAESSRGEMQSFNKKEAFSLDKTRQHAIPDKISHKTVPDISHKTVPDISHKTMPDISHKTMPDISRRTFVASVVSGAAIIPMMSLNGTTGNNWNPDLIRPPGALPESQFLSRCVKCGQCIRICPTNVIQPADILTGGFEGLWTPALNFRIGSSGCQLHCIACGNVCPTGAILPLNLDQRAGINNYAQKGPIRIGTAFVDQGRCLPWAMNRPCIVCQETCPVSPKAIMISQVVVTVNNVKVELQRPFIDPSRCIGCGVCEHECPVRGKRAIRVTAENESRSRDHVLVGK